MNILVTGAKGFVGKNLCLELKNIKEGKDKSFGDITIDDIYEFDIESNEAQLDSYCRKADFVFNLAGVNRPKDINDYMAGNYGFVYQLLETLKKHKNTCPVVLSSSTQAMLDNPYGMSKKAGEELFFNYAKETGARVLVYRFPNLFGKWCRPNYNSGIATFCYNIAHDLPVTISNRDNQLNLVYIDDLVAEMIAALNDKEHREDNYCFVPVIYTATLGQIVDQLYSFRENPNNLQVPDMSDPFTMKLYATYLSYLPTERFSYPLKMNVDDRGSFTEILRTPDRGQISVNITKPRITKGNHWHHTKNEKFVVVTGRGVIRFRKVGDPDAKIIEYYVSGDKIEAVDIPTGYTHNIENLGDTDLITIMWASEAFNPSKPDTFFEPVNEQTK